MKFHPTIFSDAHLIPVERREDECGFSGGLFNTDECAAAGFPASFVQMHVAVTARRGTVRGLHFQEEPHAQARLIRCIRGAVTDVIVDLRPTSPTYLRWESFYLSDQNMAQLLVPQGFAHGFQTMTHDTEVSCLVSAPCNQAAQRGLCWNDPLIGIRWPLPVTEMSQRDRQWPCVQQLLPV
jgi:dTDP-4-dehydrorhamnose 3,5-epimerase